jgi:hypothetical protein
VEIEGVKIWLTRFAGQVNVHGGKGVMAVMKQRTIDTAEKVHSSGEEGWEKPDNARTANAKNLAARPGQVYFDILVSSDNLRSEKLETSPAWPLDLVGNLTARNCDHLLTFRCADEEFLLSVNRV